MRLLPPFPIRRPFWFQPPLRPGEWVAYRAWQTRCLKRFVTAPEAVARRERDAAEFAATGKIRAAASEVYVEGVPMSYDVIPAEWAGPMEKVMEERADLLGRLAAA